MRGTEPQYLSCLQVQKRLHVARGHVVKLARDGVIGTRVIPGYAKPRYNAADVERLRRVAIIPARDPSPPSKPSKRRTDAMHG